jgi:hypothetical protein
MKRARVFLAVVLVLFLGSVVVALGDGPRMMHFSKQSNDPFVDGGTAVAGKNYLRFGYQMYWDIWTQQGGSGGYDNTTGIFILGPGVYTIEAWATVCDTGRSCLFWEPVEQGYPSGVGNWVDADSEANNAIVFLNETFIVSAETTFRLGSYCERAQVDYGLGRQSNIEFCPVPMGQFTNIKIVRIADI